MKVSYKVVFVVKATTIILESSLRHTASNEIPKLEQFFLFLRVLTYKYLYLAQRTMVRVRGLHSSIFFYSTLIL